MQAVLEKTVHHLHASITGDSMQLAATMLEWVPNRSHVPYTITSIMRKPNATLGGLHVGVAYRAGDGGGVPGFGRCMWRGRAPASAPAPRSPAA